MSSSTGFWDSSALTALFVREPATVQARSLAKRISPAVWWATTPEIHSAIARLRRSGDLSDRERVVAVERLNVVREGWQEIIPSDEVRERAMDLLRCYPLRAADSLQLAAALTWCQQKPSNRKFVCQDVRLCEAAAEAGFQVVQFGISVSGT